MRKLAAALLVAALMLVPVSAHAAEAPSAGSAGAANARAAVPSVVDVQLWPEDVSGGMTLVVVATVPSSAPLPAAVSIPVPSGARLTWAGEIFETTGQDVQRQPKLSADGQTATIVTEKSRLVQYEAQYKPLVDQGSRRQANLEWVQTSPADRVQFAFKLPIGSSDVKSDPAYTGKPAENKAGEKLYTVPGRKLAVGSAFKLSVSYQSQLPETAPGRQGPDVLLLSLLGLLGLAVVAVIVVALRSYGRGGGTE